MKVSNYTLYHRDCLAMMNTLSDKSIDCIICDLPYGTTYASFDKVLKRYMEKLEEENA